MAYATHAELVDYDHNIAVSVAEASRLLERASEVIDENLMGAWYPTDENGMPVDEDHRNAISRATCAQVAWFLETGDDQGISGKYNTVTIGDVSLSGGRSGLAGGATSRLAPHANTILKIAGLVPKRPLMFG